MAPHVQPCRHHGRCACSRSAVSHGLQFIEHGSHIARHADLIGYGMAGLSLLHGALDMNGRGVWRPDGQDASDKRLTARTVPMMTASPSVPLANLIGATSPCRPLKVMENRVVPEALVVAHSPPGCGRQNWISGRIVGV